MSNSTRRSSRIFRLGLLSGILLLAVDCRWCGKDFDEVAQILSVTGTVEWRRGREEDWRPASQNLVLGLADAVRTGPDGSVAVKMKNGGAIQLAPNSRLSFVLVGQEVLAVLEAGQMEADASAAQLAVGGDKEGERLTLRGGSVRLLRTEKGLRTESGEGAELTLSDGSRLKLRGELQIDTKEIDEEFELVLQTGEVEVESQAKEKPRFRLVFGETSVVSMESGRGRFVMTEEGARVQMILGNAVIEEDGVQRVVGQGTTYNMRVGRVEIIHRQDIEAYLQDAKRSSVVRTGAGRFRPPRRAVEALAPGSELEVRGRDTVALVDQKVNRIELLPGSAARFGGVYRDDRERMGEIEISRGEIALRLRRSDEQYVAQKVQTPLGTLTARSRGLTAEADVKMEANRLSIVVHSGKVDARLGEKDLAVSAGQRLVVDKDGSVEGPVDLALPLVRVQEGQTAQIFIDGAAPPLTFAFASPQKGNALLEIAAKADMKTLLLSEPLERSPFGYRLLKPGTYYWRVRSTAKDAGQPSRPSTLVIRPDPYLALSRPGSQVTNEVPDTGIETRIMFQGRAPALRFVWNRNEGAANWMFRLYAEDRLERPQLEQKVNAPYFAMPAGALKEGTYFWYQAGLDAEGRQVSQSQMNKLVLQFDNAALLLSIESPQPREKPAGNQVRLRGLAVEGAKLWANGVAVKLDSKWRFDQMLPGARPGNFVVFRLEKAGMADTYFVRQLGR